MIDYSYFEYQAKIIRTKFVSDKVYLTKRFICKLGYTPNFCSPKSFNEKVTARMLFERSPLFTKLADKCAVRELISTKIDEAFFVPLVGVYKCFDEINFEQLPNQFILKCTHDSGSAMVCRNKSGFDITAARAKITNHLKMNMYFRKREWHYKDICPQILIEHLIDLYIDPKSHSTITACRVHCFEGKPEFLEIDVQDNQGNDYSNMYNTDWELQPFRVDLKENSPSPLVKPQQLKDIIELSKKLCFTYGYSRIDFLLSQDHVYFSEITLTPNAGRMVITPAEWDFKLGSLWRSY
ncbi:ATP-grasp fold amidoligase family protein [Acinetobacter haemolyticus]|uniref:ATP-grasp fold amidoligase family protein n=1 Tax=Acinetobacter haemolyticus TaxID=29430 RepID=UPI003F573367